MRDERGQLTLYAFILMLAMLVVLGFVVDVSRWLVARDALESAAEAASLAGAQSGQRMAEVWDEYWLYKPVSPPKCVEQNPDGSCKSWSLDCRWDPPLNQRGYMWYSGQQLESDLLPDNWKLVMYSQIPSGGCCVPGTDPATCKSISVQIKDPADKEHRFVQLNGAQSAAQAAYNANLEPLQRVGAAPQGPQVAIHDSEQDPAYPSVTVRAGGQLPAWFLRLFGLGSLPVQRCSQTLVQGYKAGGHQGECGLRTQTPNADTANGWKNPDPNAWNWSWMINGIPDDPSGFIIR